MEFRFVVLVVVCFVKNLNASIPIECGSSFGSVVVFMCRTHVNPVVFCAIYDEMRIAATTRCNHKSIYLNHSIE